jgi:hypothetical protein
MFNAVDRSMLNGSLVLVQGERSVKCILQGGLICWVSVS